MIQQRLRVSQLTQESTYNLFVSSVYLGNASACRRGIVYLCLVFPPLAQVPSSPRPSSSSAAAPLPQSCLLLASSGIVACGRPLDASFILPCLLSASSLGAVLPTPPPPSCLASFRHRRLVPSSGRLFLDVSNEHGGRCKYLLTWLGFKLPVSPLDLTSLVLLSLSANSLKHGG